MKDGVMKYIILVIKIITVIICIPLIGNFIVNKIFYLNIDWAYSIFLVVSVLLVVDIIGSTFSWTNIWGRTRDIHSKMRGVIFLVLFLLIAYFPISQGISERWINSLFFVLALLTVMLFWWIEKK